MVNQDAQNNSNSRCVIKSNKGCAWLPHVIDDTTSLYNAQSRGTAQIDDVSTWLPPSLHTPWRNVFFEYINNNVCYIFIEIPNS